MAREMDKVRRQLVQNGFVARPTKSGHWKLTHPNMQGIVYASSSPSDYRGILNMQALLRRKMSDKSQQNS